MTGTLQIMLDKAVLLCLSEYNYLKDETAIIAWPQRLPKKQKEVVVRTSVQLHENIVSGFVVPFLSSLKGRPWTRLSRVNFSM